MKISIPQKLTLCVLALILALLFIYFTRDLLPNSNGVQNVASRSLSISANKVNRDGENKLNDQSINQNGKLIAQIDPKGSIESLPTSGASVGRSTVREMLSSKNIVLIDYALHRLHRVCSAWQDDNGTESLTKYVAARTESSPLESDKVAGTGTKAQRMAAAEKMLLICRGLMAEGKLSRSEMDAATATIEALGFSLRDWIKARSALGRRDAMLNETTAELGQKIFQLQLLGEISNIMLDVNAYELPQIFGADNAFALQGLAANYILMCRMGEDCSPNSLASSRFCAEEGYCGGHVEETLMNHFHKSGLDWSLFDKYVNRLQSTILTGDVTIFRKPIPTPIPIKPKKN
jgi:hypothetical protein